MTSVLSRAVISESAPIRLWVVHSYLFLLAATGRQRKYEEMRASYNSVLPPESTPAPPFAECRRISDICDHAYCRYIVTVFEDNCGSIVPRFSNAPARTTLAACTHVSRVGVAW